jgi:branched-subunit amino acid ABC-type transport system permease component
MSSALTTGIVIGLVIGVVYALISAVLVFVYEATGILNFAIGAFAMVAAYTFNTLGAVVPPVVAWLVVALASIPLGAIIGAVTLPAQGSTKEVKATASIAAVVAAQGLVLLIWGTNPRTPLYVVTGTAFSVGGVPVTWERLMAACIALVGCLLLSLFLRLTRTGSSIRATASDNGTARLIGLPVRRLWLLSWMISTFAISIVVVAILPDVGLSTDELSFIVLTPLAAVLLAGFRSVPTAAGVALGLGLVEGVFSGVSALAPYQQVCPLAVVLLALVIPGTRSALRRAFSLGAPASRIEPPAPRFPVAAAAHADEVAPLEPVPASEAMEGAP